MISINGYALSDSLVWTDRHLSQKVQQQVVRTLGGRAVVFASELLSGFNITLSGGEDYGWLTLEQVEHLEGLASVAGQTYTLHINGTDYQVVFRHHDAPAIEAAALIPRTAEASTDYFVCTLKFLSI